MAINPLSDIVLDVARAADPLQYTAAAERLQQMGAPDEAETSFDAILGSIDPDVGSSVETASDWKRADLRSRLTPLGASSAAVHPAGPYQQFEAFVLQTFVQSMLPKDASHVYGDGIAGSYWSSMLAEGIAGQMAKAGGIGIATELALRQTAVANQSAGAISAIFDGRHGTNVPAHPALFVKG